MKQLSSDPGNLKLQKTAHRPDKRELPQSNPVGNSPADNPWSIADTLFQKILQLVQPPTFKFINNSIILTNHEALRKLDPR